MRAEEFSQLVRVQPFVPLKVHLTDGTTYAIYHPDQVIVLRSRLDIGVEPDRSTGVVDRVDHCSLLHVVRVEGIPHSAPSGSDGNGDS